MIGEFTAQEDPIDQTIIDAGILPKLQVLLGHDSVLIRKECCWILSNIWAGSVSQVEAVINSGALHKIIQAINEDEIDVK